LAPAKAAKNGLKIGQPDSAFEHEADHMADEIMATSTPRLHWSLSKITTLQSKSVTSRSAIEHNSEVPSIVGEVLRSPVIRSIVLLALSWSSASGMTSAK
jgi:hypothetical protein